MQQKPNVTALLIFSTVCLMLAACAKTGYDGHNPEFTVEPDVLHFVARPGEIIEGQSVQILEAHKLLHPWRVMAALPWVMVSPDRDEGPAEVFVSVRTDGLAPGLHRSELAFVPTLPDGGEAGGEAVLVVELEILEAGWQALGGPYAAEVRAAAWDPSNPDRILVGASQNHLFESNDRGASFSPVDFDGFNTAYGPYISDIQIRDSGRVYMSIYQNDGNLGGVSRSDDGGRTWRPTGLLNLAIASMVVFDDDHLLVRGNELWYSEDAGASWQELVPPGPNYFLAPHPDAADLAILGGDAGVLFVTDGSNVVASIDTGMEQAAHGFTALDNGTWMVRSASFDGQIPVLIRSVDGGQTWQTCTGAGIPARSYSNPYPLFSSGSDLFVANGNLFRSRDAGENFTYIQEGFIQLSSSGWIRGGVAHPDGTLVIHDKAGLLWLDPQGDRLEPMPLTDHTIVGLSWHAASRNLFGVTSPGGVFHMDTAGTFEGLGPGGLSGNTWYSISVDPRSPLVLLAGAYSTGLFRSTDGGLTWIQDPVGTEALNYVRDIERAADDPDVIWAAGSTKGVWASSDGGESFLHVLEDETVTRVAPLDGRKALINLGGIQRIDMDTGVLELLIETDTPSLLTRAADGSIFYGHEFYNIHRSTDEGVNFVELPFGSGRDTLAVAVDPNDPSRIWLGYDTGLFESRDNGQTFDELFAPFPVSALSYDATGGILYVGTSGSGVYRYQPEP